MANKPTLLLADEPTGNLDSKTGAVVLALLSELLREHQVTMLLVTHDLHVAEHADQIIHLLDGHIDRIESRSEKGNSINGRGEQ